MSEEMLVEKSSANFYFLDRSRCRTALLGGGTAKSISAKKEAIRTAARLVDGGNAIDLTDAVIKCTSSCSRTNELAV
jgi:hypothetical protein